MKFPSYPPRWASEFGEDRYGIFAVFEVKGVVFKMRWIPPGEFMMGGEGESLTHLVRISSGFWLAEVQTTQEQWQMVMGDNPSHFKGESRPVESVSYDAVLDFCDSLMREVEGLQLKLPTEAEWEYSCRATTSSKFNDGSDEGLDELGWYNENSDGKTHPVKQKKANRWGLFDMHGNVWEWCDDSNREYKDQPETDPRGSQDTALRALRGGGFWYDAWGCRSAYRFRGDRSLRLQDIGFRLAARSSELRARERSDK